MALGKRKREQQEMWVATTDLPKSPGHPFYRKLNQLLAEAGFDDWVERLCAPFYHAVMGRPSIPPGVYFRMILVGYFEGVSSQRGIAWRCSDSRSLAEFLGYGPQERTPDHSSMSRTQQRLPLEVHEQVFAFVLRLAADKKLLHGKTVAVDSTMLEANAAMKSIVRKETGEDYKEYLRRLAEAEGIKEANDEDLRRFDQSRKDKKVSNEEWESKTDADSRIARMKDGTTRLAYKAEHVVDMQSDLVLAATISPADHSDAQTLCDSVMQAQINVGEKVEIEEAVADKGYHKASTLEMCAFMKWRTYIPEPKRRHRHRWTDKPPEYRAAVYGNRRRVRGARGKRLQRLRSELTERSFAHVCETGGARRCWLRGLEKVTKRYLIQVAARNLSLILRKLFGVGTPRSLQGLMYAFRLLYFYIMMFYFSIVMYWRRPRPCWVDVH
ncbi:MAG: DDE transposase [Gemmatales bacterium]|nr:MAG: DDE transposase [Gemmatales bacterium]GIW80668.1 MAG: DDE transposase [Gemmatales bacterium]GIW81060.1 MAG: DDE transposase [Gemmatales bacterium]GIW81587.1 MAG: DDE transposase [Gemmatales bacterium]GIW82869.1 MAG: DDE transposase [Gemmatales bacterium]